MQLATKIQNNSTSRVLLSFTIPAVLSTVLLSARYMIDSFFACKVSDDCVSIVNMVFPLIAIIQSLGYWIGMGTASIYSKKVGQKEVEGVKYLIKCGMILSVLAGIVLLLIGQYCPDSLLAMLSIRNDASVDAKLYLRLISYSAVILMLNYFFENVFRAMGHLYLVLLSAIGGGLTNVGVVALLFKMQKISVKSIGIGFVAGQMVYFVLLVAFYLKTKKKESGSRIQKKIYVSVFEVIATIASILWIGIPSLVRQGIGCGYLALVNHITKNYGEVVQTALAVANKTAIVIFAIAIGCSQATQPLIGYFYGAKEKEKIKQVYLKSIKYGTMATFVAVIAVLFLGDYAIAFWTKEKEVQSIARTALFYQLFVFCFVMPANATNMLYQACNKPVMASVLAALRQGIIGIPVLIIMPKLLGQQGLLFVQPVADIITIGISILFAYLFFATTSFSKKDLQS